MAGSIIAVKGNCDNSEIDGIFNFGLTYIRNITLKKLDGGVIRKKSKTLD